MGFGPALSTGNRHKLSAFSVTYKLTVAFLSHLCKAGDPSGPLIFLLSTRIEEEL